MTSHGDIRERLTHRLAQLVARTGRIESDLRQPGHRDWAERAIEQENEEVLERLGAAELEEMREIRAALGRIDAGTYGVCEACGEAIPAGRLRVLPFAATCIACAEEAPGGA